MKIYDQLPCLLPTTELNWIYRRFIRRPPLFITILIIFGISTFLLSLMKTNVYDNSVRNGNIFDAEPTCKEKRTMGFLKTHKTASSTVQNILLRYGFVNDLNFVLPWKGHYIISLKPLVPFNVSQLDRYSSLLPWHKTLKTHHQYDIFALHTCWNHLEVSSLFGPESVYFTILRKPSDVFESLYSYFNLKSVFNATFSQYVTLLNVSPTLFKHRIWEYYGLNQQLVDLGLNFNLLYNLEASEDLILQMEKNFDLVMISERFEESMVLLADLLCWPLEKVTSFKLNARKPELKQKITRDEIEILSKWQSGEELVYRHFHQRFEKKIDAYGREKMKKSVSKLRKLNEDLAKRCIQEITDNDHLEKESDLAPWSLDVEAFKVDENDYQCKLMGMSEIPFVNKIREKQFKRWTVT